MGHKQLHLIVLGIILVLLAMAVGVAKFNNSAVQSNRDAVIMDLNTLSLMAKTYYKKDNSLGGGNYSFLGYKIPERLRNNENGNYSIISTQAQKIVVQGVGVEKEGASGCSQSNNISYYLVIEPHQTQLIKIK